MALNLRNCKIVFDKEVWERVYAYLLSGGRGKRFAKYESIFFGSLHLILVLVFLDAPGIHKTLRYMGENLEYMVEAALADYFRFQIHTTNPTIILPPYAGHKGKPHVASQVLELRASYVALSSVDPKTETPEEFSQGTFTYSGNKFPYLEGDITGIKGTSPVASQKFHVNYEGMWIRMMATPESHHTVVLEPVDVHFHVWFHDFLDPLPLDSPEMEVFSSFSDFRFRMNQSQYQYFLMVFSERLAWAPKLYDKVKDRLPPELTEMVKEVQAKAQELEDGGKGKEKEKEPASDEIPAINVRSRGHQGGDVEAKKRETEPDLSTQTTTTTTATTTTTTTTTTTVTSEDLENAVEVYVVFITSNSQNKQSYTDLHFAYYGTSTKWSHRAL